MDIQRLLLFVVFSFSLLMLWEAWQKEQHPVPVQTAAQNTAAKDGIPAAPASTATGSANAAAKPGTGVAPAGTVPAAAVPATAAPQAHETIKVQTDVVSAEIDTLGGDIVRLELLRYPASQQHTMWWTKITSLFTGQHPADSISDDPNLVLLGPEHQYFAQSGLIGEGLPNHKTLYRAAAKSATLAEGSDKLEVRLTAEGTGPAVGVRVTKVITFHRGSYLVDVAHEVSNGATAPVAPVAYFHLTRDGRSPGGDPGMVSTFTGVAYYSEQDKFQKIDFSDINKEPLDKKLDNGWIAMVQHYFVSALLPPDKQAHEIYTDKVGDALYRAGVKLPMAAVAPGATATAAVRLYSGPEDQDKLQAIAPGLERSVDYGRLTILAEPLFWVLKFFHNWLGNWGLAIIALTISVKLLFFPLSAASYRSMAKMKLVQPRLQKLREQYGDDRMKLNQAMMDLYKQEKINPLGGCLPIVIQIPVFIALYWTLLASVELRHAPFYGWITDLSSADPYSILPALMMLSMIVQTKLNPTPPDPVQAKVMMIMPFAFGIMFFAFPAGLVLYWVVNNILSILQQWQIQRMIGTPKAATSKS
ncbi:MAG TPA: membrane protein insertase YidC [Burkholderiales bacterium]|nr:membrane protein insertase YidC [Burkholderiales bacterium]